MATANDRSKLPRVDARSQSAPELPPIEDAVSMQRNKPAAEEVPELPRNARVPQVFASACPTNPAHKNTKVYGKRGVIRFCKCNDCGETWKQSGPEPAAK